jgi:hypothetical protein
MLINNEAFVLINMGRLDEAEYLLKKVDPRAIDDLSTVTLIATQGLLSFRKGFPSVGRNLYLDAMDLAKRQSNPHYVALAAIHLAIEEIRANTGQRSESFKNATELASRADEADVRHVYARLAKMAEVAKLTPE